MHSFEHTCCRTKSSAVYEESASSTARRSRPGVDLLKAETTARWLVAMRDQEERASEERRQVYKHH